MSGLGLVFEPYRAQLLMQNIAIDDGCNLGQHEKCSMVYLGNIHLKTLSNSSTFNPRLHAQLAGVGQHFAEYDLPLLSKAA